MTLPIICFDLDGTLVGHNGTIHPRDIEILQSECQVVWIPATGRMLHSVRDTFVRHNLFVDQPIPFPVVVQNGAGTYLPGEQLHDYLAFEPELQAKLIGLIEDHPTLATFFSSVDELHVMHGSAYAQAAADHYDFHIQSFTSDSYQKHFGKVMCLSQDPAILAKIAAATADLPVEQAFSMSSIFEVTPPGANKGDGLRRLLATMQLSSAPVYVVGDGGNDLTLFAAGTRSFAPLSSPAEIQARVDQVIDAGPEGILTPILRHAGIMPPEKGISSENGSRPR